MATGNPDLRWIRRDKPQKKWTRALALGYMGLMETVKINPSKRVRSWYRRFVEANGKPQSLREFARGLASAPSIHAEISDVIRATPAMAKSVAIAWCNNKCVRVSR